ncbi:distal tail protein Dit [Streptococcus sp. H31]|uniref:distal tail protein Dit n=1 Tax=Streptococcus huangxiaojuni TaxID=3237239 RepID=UPI0034A40C9B
MYDYQTMHKSATGKDNARPSDDLMINSRYVSDLVDGYRQLYVSGRGLVGQEINTVTIPRRAGVWVDETRTEEIEIKIYYQLTAKTSSELRNKFTLLNKILRGAVSGAGSPALTISFADEIEYDTTAYLKEVESIPEQSLSLKSSFTLLVPDPYKRQKDKQMSSGNIALTEAYEVLPERIVAYAESNTTTISVTNGRTTIAFKGQYLLGRELEIIWKSDEVTATFDGKNILYEMTNLSIPEDFYIRDKDLIRGTNLTIQTVEWRDKRL